ncbi:unnamed protein product, partial [Effrenium voratum]
MLSVLMLVILSWNASSSSSSFFLPVFLARCRVEHIYECLLSRSAALEVARLIAPPRQEAEEAGDERARAEEERKKKLELALHLDDRRFNTAEANDSYIKFVRKGLKAEESTISRVPQLGRGLDESSVFEVIDLAISRKNDRTWAETLDSAERFRLTPMDFGLDVLTAEQRERRMREVEAEVASLVGWGTEEDAGSARHFFYQLRRQLGSARGSGHSAAAAGGAAALHMPRALRVAANAGSGRETFVRLATCFLRAAGAISREEVVWVDAQELCEKGDPAEILQTRLLAAEHGCLAIKDVEALVDSREAVRALAQALGNVDGAASASTLVVILGTQAGLARVARMEPALEARFPTNVSIPDFTSLELVQFMEDCAAKLPSGALAFEQNLGPRLAEHLNEVYGGGGQGK